MGKVGGPALSLVGRGGGGEGLGAVLEVGNPALNLGEGGGVKGQWIAGR